MVPLNSRASKAPTALSFLFLKQVTTSRNFGDLPPVQDFAGSLPGCEKSPWKFSLLISARELGSQTTLWFSFTEISAVDFKKFVATGAHDEQVAKWIEETAKKRPRVEIIKWNNDWRYRRISEMPDPIQEFMEGYVPQFVPAEIRHHIDYFFDIYDAEEKRIQA